jgi:2-hydroxy-3-keto-5-methylthiopentenyl-1-phosphate phosphatase
LERKVLVTDFDGTMTDHDFYQLVLDKLLPPDVPDHWSDYRAGRLTHFEALRRYFAAIPADDSADEAAVLRLVDSMGLVPDLAAWIDRLDSSGWGVVIASAGCRWYIDRLLDQSGVKLETHTNDGDFTLGQGLVMRLPTNSPFFSRTHGVDKAAVVSHAILHHSQVAFAGDGFPDEEAARMVPAELRFARGDLAGVLEKAGLAFHRFESWAEVAGRLSGDSVGGS